MSVTHVCRLRAYISTVVAAHVTRSISAHTRSATSSISCPDEDDSAKPRVVILTADTGTSYRKLSYPIFAMNAGSMVLGLYSSAVEEKSSDDRLSQFDMLLLERAREVVDDLHDIIRSARRSAAIVVDDSRGDKRCT
jgi:hypothetical protein